MKKTAILFALLIALSGCGSAQPTASSQANVSNESSTSQNATDLDSSSKDAASEAAASQAAASEVAASQAAASEVAASQAAASEAAASEAAASEAATFQAAASEAAVKSASEVSVEESSSIPEPESSSSNTPTKATVKAVTGTNFLSSVEKLVLRKINREREAEGFSALTYNEDLRSAARLRSRELYKANKFEHKRPNGDEWNTVLDEDIPVDYIAAGENLCMTEYNDPNNKSGKSATFWVDQWMESPPHYKNIMRSEYTHAGVGIYYIEKGGMVYAYATMIFAQL